MADHVFICYAHEDQDFVLKLAANLKERGARVWLDQWDIPPGDDWDLTIDNALYDCAQFLIVLSPAAVASDEVRGEVRTALNENKPIVPVLYQTCRIPRRLQLIHYVDFTACGPDDGAALGQVLRALGVRVPPPEPVRPPRQAPPHSTIPEAEAAPVEEVVSAEAVPVEEVEIPDWLRILREEGLLEGLEEPTLEEPRPLFELDMILIPPGEFLYGRKKKRVILPQFWIDETPVTNAEYARFVAQMGHRPPLHWEGKTPPKRIADHPVTRVSWHDAVAYAEWAGKRLPTEEEWEKAARGSDGREYPWGDGFDPNRCNTRESGIGKTTPVGQYSPQGDSPYGCVDMAGNVWEWTASDYDKSNKVLRGGSWDNYQGDALCAHRGRYSPLNWYISVGFRCALR